MKKNVKVSSHFLMTVPLSHHFNGIYQGINRCIRYCTILCYIFKALPFFCLFNLHSVVEKITTISTNPSFLLKFSTMRFRHVSAYFQVMFNTDEQFLFYNFIMILKGNKLTRLNKLT